MVLVDNTAVNKFIEMVNNTSSNKRLVAYYGIAEAIACHVCHATAQNVKTEEILNKINEIFIMDRDLLKSCILKTLKLKVELSNPTDISKVYTSNSLLDYLKITDYYSTTDIFDINKHFEVFRHAIHTTNALLAYMNKEGKI